MSTIKLNLYDTYFTGDRLLIEYYDAVNEAALADDDLFTDDMIMRETLSLADVESLIPSDSLYYEEPEHFNPYTGAVSYARQRTPIDVYVKGNQQLLAEIWLDGKEAELNEQAARRLSGILAVA